VRGSDAYATGDNDRGRCTRVKDGSTPDDASATFAALLRRYRLRADLSQDTLAGRAGISLGAITAYENGRRKRVNPTYLRRLADVLGLSAAERTLFEASVDRRRGAKGKGGSGATLGSDLPRNSTPLYGRGDIVSAVRDAVEGGDHPVVTLIGAPGVGKTSVALEVASGLGHAFPDGVVYVPFEAHVAPDDVATAIAQALCLSAMDIDSTPLAAVRHALRRKRILLVLDNVEHVVNGVVSIVSALTAEAGARVLVASRSALRVRAERQIPIPPLATPPVGVSDPHTLASYPSVELFRARARGIAPTIDAPALAPVVAAICRRLDGLPLSIELASARVALLLYTAT